MSLVDLGQKVSNYLQNVNIRWGQMYAAIKMSNQVWSNAKKCQISGQMQKKCQIRLGQWLKNVKIMVKCKKC